MICFVGNLELPLLLAAAVDSAEVGGEVQNCCFKLYSVANGLSNKVSLL